MLQKAAWESSAHKKYKSSLYPLPYCKNQPFSHINSKIHPGRAPHIPRSPPKKLGKEGLWTYNSLQWLTCIVIESALSIQLLFFVGSRQLFSSRFFPEGHCMLFWQFWVENNWTRIRRMGVLGFDQVKFFRFCNSKTNSDDCFHWLNVIVSWFPTYPISMIENKMMRRTSEGSIMFIDDLVSVGLLLMPD